MKKSNLITGILFVLAGVAFLFAALSVHSKLGSLLFGFASACIVPGIVMVCKYFYWNAPNNRERYEKRLESERIELHDELKEKLRDKSGRYAYLLGLMIISLSMVLFSVLGALELIESSRLIVVYLGGYLVFQIAAGIVIFNGMLKKY